MTYIVKNFNFIEKQLHVSSGASGAKNTSYYAGLLFRKMLTLQRNKKFFFKDIYFEEF